MAVAVTIHAEKNLVNNSDQGVRTNSCYLTVTGLTEGQTNTFSATSDGTSTGAPLLPNGASLRHAPVYIPNDATNLAAWAEAADPTTDANGNLQFAIAVAASGPESFRIALFYGTN